MTQPPPTIKPDLLSGLLKIFTEEQARQLIDMCANVRARAVDRKCDQSLTIFFNDRGHPRNFNGSDTVNAIKPVMYKAE